MEKLLKQLKNAQKISMTASEKQSMRSHFETLVGHGASAPHMPSEKINDIRKPMVSPYSGNMFGIGMLVRVAAFVLVGFIVGGSTLTFASSNSLPGDKLYSIKTKIAEPLRRGLAFSVESKAKFDSERVQTRLSELKTLKDSGKLTDPNISTLAENSMDETFKDYKNSLADLKDEGRAVKASEIARATLTTLESSHVVSKPKVQSGAPMLFSKMMFSAAVATEAKDENPKSTIDTKLNDLSTDLKEITNEQKPETEDSNEVPVIFNTNSTDNVGRQTQFPVFKQNNTIPMPPVIKNSTTQKSAPKSETKPRMFIFPSSIGNIEKDTK